MVWLQELLDNTLFQAFLAIIAIVGFVYGFIFQRINKEKRELSYIKKSNALIRGKKSEYEKLSISYAGQQIESLCVSNIVIWNSGNRTLSNSDIVETKEIAVTAADNNMILDVEIVAASEETNKFSVIKVDDHCVKVVFDYADSRDGVAIQVIHTGTEDSIALSCKIKGGRPLRNHINEALPNMIRKAVNPNKYDKFMVVLCGIAVLIFLIMALLMTLSIFIPDLQDILLAPGKEATVVQSPQTSLVPMTIMLWASGLVLAALYIPLIKKLFFVGIPHKLKQHL